jgi:hypothetical protein
VARFLKHVIELALHPFPDAKTVGFDDHATAYGAVGGQIGVFDDVEVPLTVVFCSGVTALAI